MFTEIGDEGLECCPSLPIVHYLIRKAGVLVCFKSKRQAEVIEFQPEDSGLSKWHLDLVVDALRTLELMGKKQRLSRANLITLLQLLGHCPNMDYLEQILEELGVDNKEVFTFGDLCCIWKKFIDNHDDEVKLLQKAFQFFDKDNDGSLSIDEFQIANRELGNLLTDEEIKQFVDLVDVTHDGNIQYEELLMSLMAQYTRVIDQLEAEANNESVGHPSSAGQRISSIVGSFKAAKPQEPMARDGHGASSSGLSITTGKLEGEGPPQIGAHTRPTSICSPSLKALLAEPVDLTGACLLAPDEEENEVEPSYPSNILPGANNESDSRTISIGTDKTPSSYLIQNKEAL
mmetsp:Transcript_36437/g.102922  ORF Transcript_36437/g.102922 Transcript_36437/m.102922 type:complete len:346 (+) Transcript_36437:34-1071(+)